MDVNSVIELSRDITHTDDIQITDTKALRYLNIVYHTIANRIIEDINEDYFWDVFTTDTILNQNEYTFNEATATTNWMNKIQRVEVKWKSTDEFSTLIEADTLASYKTSEWRINNKLSTDEWFFDIKDWSIFIYPAPTEAVEAWMRVQSTITLQDLVLWGAESTIFPRNSDLRGYHQILSVWMKQYIYSQQGLTNEKNDSINEFNQKLTQMISNIKDRYNNPVEAILPNAINLKT